MLWPNHTLRTCASVRKGAHDVDAFLLFYKYLTLDEAP